MYILKLEKISEEICIFVTHYTNFSKLNLLGEFLEDYGFPHKTMREHVNFFFEDSKKNCLIGNKSCIEKKNDIFLISYQFSDDDEYLEMPQESLKKLMPLYWDARAKCPQEIIIKLDENMENPIVETIQ